MKFTTHFALQAQEARLFEHTPYETKLYATNGILTLYDAPFQEDLCIGRALVACL